MIEIFLADFFENLQKNLSQRGLTSKNKSPLMMSKTCFASPTDGKRPFRAIYGR